MFSNNVIIIMIDIISKGLDGSSTVREEDGMSGNEIEPEK